MQTFLKLHKPNRLLIVFLAMCSSHLWATELGGVFNPKVDSDPQYHQATTASTELMQISKDENGADVECELPTPTDEDSNADYEAALYEEDKIKIKVKVTLDASESDSDAIYAAGKVKLKVTSPDGTTTTYQSDQTVDSGADGFEDGDGKDRNVIATVTIDKDKALSGQETKLELVGVGKPSGGADTEVTFGPVTISPTCMCHSCEGDVDTDTDGSMVMKINIGGGQFGKSSGLLFLHQENADADTFSPASLKFRAGNGMRVLRNGTALRQILTQTNFVDIVPTSGTNQGYEIRLYKAGAQGAFDSSANLYAAPTTAAYKIVRISNPDTTGTQLNHVTITENPDQSSALVSAFAYDAYLKEWFLTKGGIRQESKSKSVQGDVTTTIKKVFDGNGQTVAKVQSKLQKFGFGMRPVEEINDPDGVALKTTYSYFTTGNGRGQVQTQTNPDGSWTKYQYDAAGHIIKEDKGLLNAAVGGASSTTEYSYATTNPKQTVVERVGGNVIRRSWVIDNGLEAKTIRAADSSITNWADPANLVSTTVKLGSGEFKGYIQSTLAEDGTLTTYSYSRSGDLQTTTVERGVANTATPPVVADGTRTITIVNHYGNAIAETTTDILSSLDLDSWVATGVDDRGRVTSAQHADGTTESWNYDCCHLMSQTDRQGIVTTYSYDALGRQQTVTRLGITERQTMDAEGRVTKRERIGTDASVTVLEETTYDAAGRVTSTKDAAGKITLVNHPANGGHTTTTTYPDGGTRVETTYADGRVQEIAGTAVAPVQYEYGTWSGGEWTKEIKVGANASTTEWIKTYTNALGRTVKMEYPDGAYASMEYDGKGRLMKQTDPDGVTTLFTYDSRNRLFQKVIDLNQNGQIDLGSDRVNETSFAVVTAHGQTVNRTTTSIYANGTTPTVVQISERGVDGRSQWQTNFGQTTSTVTSLPSGGVSTVTTTNPDGSQTVQTLNGGRVTAVIQKASNGTTLHSTGMTYDPHGRLLTQTDARTGTTSYTYTARDQVLTTTAPAPTSSGSPLVTIFGYDDMGRQTSVTLPDSSVTTTGYDLRGNVTSQGGSQTYNVTYTFDPQNRMASMTTQGQAGNADTAWIYDGQRGWLNRKQYADGQGTNYTYTAAGRLLTRTWARTVAGNPLVTTYGYNTAGELTSTDYSDSTPDVVMTHTRFGTPSTITDATGTRTISYNAQLQPETETLPATFFGGRNLTRKYDALHRPTGFELGTTSDPDADHAVIYGYDNAGRLSSVQDPSNTWNYAFETNAPNLISSVTNGSKTVAYTYETGRNAVASITNKVGTTILSAYTYISNDLGQRTTRTQSGNAFASSATETFGYNAKGEVISSAHSADTTRNTAFDYDGIGNRNGATSGGVTTSYAANSLNQYTTINPGTAITPMHDADGNMVSDGAGKTLVWDAENRLIEVRNASNDLIATYTYEGQSRRVKKQTTALAPQGATEEIYLYDGWNRIATYTIENSTFALQNCLTWGRDLSGSLQGAGGIGGLLGVKEYSGSHTGNYTFHYDANGNISEVLTTSGSITAHYEYDPFGNAVVAIGTYASANVWRLSTKYQDEETGLLYYGYRFYQPAVGRWINRDPINEIGFRGLRNRRSGRAHKGGEHNLYAFVSNKPVSKFDLFGLKELSRISVEFYNSSDPNALKNAVINGIDHPSSGRQFKGMMATFYKDGENQNYQVKSGGNVDLDSEIKKRPGWDPVKDDTATPSGSYSVETHKSDDATGYLIQDVPGRTFIQIHFDATTTGCIVFDDDPKNKNWEKFKCDMADTNKAGHDTIPIKVWYRMADGSKPPHGNTGDGTDDSGGSPGPWPDTEGPFEWNRAQ